MNQTDKELSNKELTRIKFSEFLAKQKPGLVAFEACATAHHWARLATTWGHQVKIIPAISVAPFRQGHKTDKDENGLPMSYHPTLHLMLMRFRAAEEDLAFMDEQIKQVIKLNDGCQRLTALEGVGPIGAILIFATLGSGDAFKNGQEFSAYLGLTPKQYSSGGKTNVIGISRHITT